jgi:hypothetical protein
MKEKALVLIAIITGALSSVFGLVPLDIATHSSLPETANSAFKPGEKLTYKIHYGIIDAGEAEHSICFLK